MDMTMNKDELNLEPHELSIDQLDEVSAGFVWILAVAGGFAAGVLIRAGFDWVAHKLN